MGFDLMSQVDRQLKSINERRKKKDEKAPELKLNVVVADHINVLEGYLKRVEESARRFKEDKHDLERMGIDIRKITDEIVSEIKRIF